MAKNFFDSIMDDNDAASLYHRRRRQCDQTVA